MKADRDALHEKVAALTAEIEALKAERDAAQWMYASMRDRNAASEQRIDELERDDTRNNEASRLIREAAGLISSPDYIDALKASDRTAAALRTALGHVHDWIANTPWDKAFIDEALAIDAVVLDAINAKPEPFATVPS